MERLLPTGTCWCGCGTRVDLGSFFAPGHDKRAEARVIMQVFGGVPQFLAALGFGPGGDGTGATASTLESAMRLLALPNGSRFAIEFPDEKDRTGRLHRHLNVERIPVNLKDGSATFNVVHGPTTSSVSIPFVDILTVYKDIVPAEGIRWVVRVTGVLEPTSSIPAGIKYVALNHPPPPPRS